MTSLSIPTCAQEAVLKVTPRIIFDNRVRDFQERTQVLIVKVSTDYDGLLRLMSSQI